MDARKRFIQIGVILIIGLGVVVFMGGNYKSEAPKQEPVAEEPETVADEQVSVSSAESRTFDTLREFTSAEFKQAYDNIALPNITPVVVAPEITGNTEADAYIQKQAEERGYQLRDVASGVLNEIDGNPVQELLIASWNDLQQMATEEGIAIQFRSGYRPIEEQRELFTDRMVAAGVATDAIASGSEDAALDAVLATTAPPGYSRHHGGYTIDVEDPGFSVFASSTAYTWISANNFEKAKLHGFIPSYPNGLTNQGPNPEPWEFVWVSPGVTYE